MACNGDDKDWSPKWKECFLHELTARPKAMTEVRRDGKDDAVISKVIAAELDRRLGGQTEDKKKVSCNFFKYLQLGHQLRPTQQQFNPKSF